MHRQRKGQTAASASIKGRTGALIQVVALSSLDRDGLLALRARSGNSTEVNGKDKDGL